MEEYEALVAAIVMIDGAIQNLEDVDHEGPARIILNDTRNVLNAERVAMLGNGAQRPFSALEALEGKQ
ncbi:MAG: hypothetical protein ACRBBK_07740 [Paracoccaceae bacterium]